MQNTVAGKTVYISGAISSDPNYGEKFHRAHIALMGAGARKILNPTELPAGWEYDEYMEHCMLMVRRADVLVMLPCWTASPGAQAERAYALSLRRTVIDFEG